MRYIKTPRGRQPLNVRVGRYAQGWAVKLGNGGGIDAGSINAHKAGVYPDAEQGEKAVRVVVLEEWRA